MELTYPDGKLILGDCLEVLPTLEENSVDLVFCSPPYESARLYLEEGEDLGIARKTEEWVLFMRDVVKASLRVCKGLVAMVVGHGKGARKWSGAPALLCADLIRLDGICLRSPAWYKRNGIMGSGTSDWLRADLEWIICATKSKEKLPWSDNTCCGSPPKYTPGGDPSHQTRDGRVPKKPYKPPEKANPGNIIDCQALNYIDPVSFLEGYQHATKIHTSQILRELREAIDSKEISRWWARIYSRVHEEAILQSLLQRKSESASKWTETRRTAPPGKRNSEKKKSKRHMREMQGENSSSDSSSRRGCNEQRNDESGGFVPVVSSPGTQKGGVQCDGLREAVYESGVLLHALLEIQKIWRSVSEEICMPQTSTESSNVINCIVGGGHMGSRLSSGNEAPFPEQLANFFIKSFCPPGGLVLDPFAGSFTTAACAIKNGRKFIGIDLRKSQIELGKRRIKEARLNRGFQKNG